MSLLSVRGLAIDYATKGGTLHAVSRGTLDVGEAEVVGLVGESGCGKTTLARALTGIVPRNATFMGGEIVFEGRDVLHGRPGAWRDLLWRKISFVPQSSMNALDPVYRVGAQMTEVLRLTSSSPWSASTRAARANIRTSSPAGCGSVQPSPWRLRFTQP